MQEEFYKQCLLKNNGQYQTAWIPERGAVAGKSVELKEDNLFWEVMEVFPTRISGETLKVQQAAARTHRDGTDI